MLVPKTPPSHHNGFTKTPPSLLTNLSPSLVLPAPPFPSRANAHPPMAQMTSPSFQNINPPTTPPSSRPQTQMQATLLNRVGSLPHSAVSPSQRLRVLLVIRHATHERVRHLLATGACSSTSCYTRSWEASGPLILAPAFGSGSPSLGLVLSSPALE